MRGIQMLAWKMNKQFLENIALATEKRQMAAFIDGLRVKVLVCENIDWSEIKLLKIYPRSVKSEALLIVEIFENRLKLYSHRTSELTRAHKGKQITEKWIIDFINNNEEVARKITLAHSPAQPKAGTASREYSPLSQEEVQTKKSERNRVSCSCLGEVENCAHCFGQGYYVTNGFGKKI